MKSSLNIISATRDAAEAAFENFLPHAGLDYAAKRNFDLGPEDRSNVSGLSAYIRRRMLHEREIVDGVLQKHPFVKSAKFLQEVLWRSYWKGWMEMRPGLWEFYKQKVTATRLNLLSDSSLSTRYEAAISGATGIQCFDAWNKELLDTGYLHNHARMWYASIWIFSLNLPWELGADFFFQQLLDADPASNTLSWRWVAGLHTRGKHYLATSDNIAEFTNGRFASTPGLIEDALPLTESAQFEISKVIFPARQTFTDVALLIHPEHLLPEEFELRVEPTSIITISDLPSTEFIYNRCQRSEDFDRAAVLDAGARAASHFNCPHLDLTCADAAKLDLPDIVTPYAPLGDVQERLLEFGAILSDADISLTFVTDDWDETFYPLAKKGFFDFRKVLESEARFKKLVG